MMVYGYLQQCCRLDAHGNIQLSFGKGDSPKKLNLLDDSVHLELSSARQVQEVKDVQRLTDLTKTFKPGNTVFNLKSRAKQSKEGNVTHAVPFGMPGVVKRLSGSDPLRLYVTFETTDSTNGRYFRTRSV